MVPFWIWPGGCGKETNPKPFRWKYCPPAEAQAPGRSQPLPATNRLDAAAILVVHLDAEHPAIVRQVLRYSQTAADDDAGHRWPIQVPDPGNVGRSVDVCEGGRVLHELAQPPRFEGFSEQGTTIAQDHHFQPFGVETQGQYPGTQPLSGRPPGAVRLHFSLRRGYRFR